MYIENPNIQYDLAARASNYVESMYAPPPIVPMQSNTHLMT
jgi:hypothetical protein